jgi:hypothetical protein
MKEAAFLKAEEVLNPRKTVEAVEDAAAVLAFHDVDG